MKKTTMMRFAVVLLVPLFLTACAHKGQTPKESVETSSTSSATLKSRLDEILHRRDDGTLKYTARVIELDTGRELYAVTPDEPFMPASNMKLSVSAAFRKFSSRLNVASSSVRVRLST